MTETLIIRDELKLHISYPETLPVSGEREVICAALRQHPVLIVTGETGSGKTTQLPKMLLELGHGQTGMIALTQPRRLSAIAMATRLREETRSQEQSHIVHSIRFDDHAGKDTIVRVMTDGLLLREAARDPYLRAYDAIMIDEAHERSLNIDCLLGLLKRARKKRPELQIIITSASIDAQRFADFFAEEEKFEHGTGEIKPAPVIHVSGRLYPVAIEYRAPADNDIDYVSLVVETVEEIQSNPEPGDILCFLPNERDIMEIKQRLERSQYAGGMRMCPLFGRLTAHEQQHVFATSRKRKIILATNIAETSITVPGIRTVIDSGLARSKRFHVQSGTERLPIEAVSKSSCIQRTGRAGRLGPGVCIRLYSEDDYEKRADFTEPEIQRSNLAGVLLQARVLRWGDPIDFPWLDAPRPQAWQQAQALLEDLGACTEKGVLTAIGQQMARIPTDPRLARMLIAGYQMGVCDDVCSIAAFLSLQDPRMRPVGEEDTADMCHAQWHDADGDIATVVRLWDAYTEQSSASKRSRFVKKNYLSYRRMREWADVRRQFRLLMNKHGRSLPQRNIISDSHSDMIHKAVLTGLLSSVLRYNEEQACYFSGTRSSIFIHPSSLFAKKKTSSKKQQQQNKDAEKNPQSTTPRQEWLMSCEVVETSRCFARMCAPIKPEWIMEVASHCLKRSFHDPHYNRRRGRVQCTERLSWKNLIVQDGKPCAYVDIDPQAATDIFIHDALVGERLGQRPAFMKHNKRIRKLLNGLRARLRDPSIIIDENDFIEFYKKTVAQSSAKGVCADDRTLKKLLSISAGESESMWHFNIESFIDSASWERASHSYPDDIHIGGERIALQYRYDPAHALDGVSLRVREEHLAWCTEERLALLIPGWLPEQCEYWLRQLPKDVRRHLMPLRACAEECVKILHNENAGLDRLRALCIERTDGMAIPEFSAAVLPDHLRPCIILENDAGENIFTSRHAALIRSASGVDPLAVAQADWQTAPERSWTEDIPDSVVCQHQSVYIGLIRSRDAQARAAVQQSAYASRQTRDLWHADAVHSLWKGLVTETADAFPCSLAIQNIDQKFACSSVALRTHLLVAMTWEAACAHEPTLASGLVCAPYNEAIVVMRSNFQKSAAEVDALLSKVFSAFGKCDKELRRGSKTFGAAAVIQQITRERQRLLMLLSRCTWKLAQKIPQYCADVHSCLSRLPQLEKRTQEWLRNHQDLIEQEESFAHLPDNALLRNLGLQAQLRAAAELCALAYAEYTAVALGTGSRKHALDYSREWVRLMNACADEVDTFYKQREKILAPCREILPFLKRLETGFIQKKIIQQMEQLLHKYPDCSLGSDIPNQTQAMQQLLEDARMFLERSGK